MVPSIKRNAVISAIIQAGAGGVTIAETRGRGSGERPMIGGARGTARYIAEYARTDTITTIVDDSILDSVVRAIINAAHTGKKGDGKIFVSTIDETYDISTKGKATV